MKNYFYQILLAFFGGLGGRSLLFVLFYWVAIPSSWSGQVLASLLVALINGISEEGSKFLLIKKLTIRLPYGFIFGISWSGIEILLHYMRGILPPLNIANVGLVVGLQTFTVILICYAIQKRKPVFGLLAALIIHAAYDFVV